MKPKTPLTAACFILGSLGLLGLAAASGCSSAPDAAAVDASVDSAEPDGTPLDPGACSAGTADCDGDPRNGCESKISTDPKNCGACTHDCTGLPHVSGATTCEAGKCVVPATSCAMGYGHCSGNTDDGCEADLTKPATCGNCTTSCSGATSVCANGSCSSGCPSNAPTQCSGSCVDTTQSPTNCATCGHACTSPTHGQATCASSACGFACNSGYHACGAGCADNTDPMTCGSSCTPCATPPGSGRAVCDGTSCSIACDPTFHLCGGNCDSNTSTASCGSSCTPCPTPPNTQPTCNGVTCGYTCNAGYTDCDGQAANGCEVQLASDSNNCGACFHSCLGGACSANACQPFALGALSGGSGATDIILDATYVFFRWSAAAYRINKTTHALQFIWEEPTPVSASSFATDGTRLFAGTIDGHIFSFDKDGGNIATVFTSATSSPIAPLAVGAGRLYFYDTIFRSTALDGTNATTAYGTRPTFLAGDGTSVLCSGTQSGSVNGIWSAAGSPFISSILNPAPSALALDSTTVYFTDGTLIGAVARSSSSETSLTTISSGTLGRLAVDASNIYFIIAGPSGSIGRLPLSGGTPVTIATGQANPSSIAVDGTAIYWTNSDTNSVSGLAK